MTRPGSLRVPRLALAVLLLALLGTAAGADFRAGLAFYQRGDYASALREWRPLAEGGDATAQLYLGLMYENGHGLPVDFAEARRWFERAAAAFPEGEDRKRATAGRDRAIKAIAEAPVDAALVGRWQTTAPDPVTGGVAERVWDIAGNGQFAMTTARKGKDGTAAGRSVERGQIRAKDGRWSYTLPNQTFEGTYRVIAKDAFETTGPLGISQWTRVGSAPASGGTVPAAGSPEPLPPAPGRVLKDDEFGKPGRWPEASLPACRTSYGDGGYVIATTTADNACTLWHKTDAWPDRVRIELQARLRKGRLDGAWGLLFGMPDEQGTHMYALAISAEGKFQLSEDRAQLIPWTAEPAIRKGLGPWNTLAVDVQGKTLTAFINGKRVGSVQANREARGAAGFFVGLPDHEMVVTRLRVSELPASGPAVTPAGPPLFDEDFRSERRWTEGTANVCRAAYRDGGYVLEAVTKGEPCWQVWRAPSWPARVRIEAEARLLKGNEASAWGLAFGVSEDWKEGYSLAVSADGSFRLADRTLKLLVPWSASPAVRKGAGAVNSLAVEIQGRAMSLFLNGQQVGTYQAPRDVVGRVGIYVGEAGNEVLFTRLRVTELGGARPGLPAVAQPRVLEQTDFRSPRVWPAAARCKVAHEDGGLTVENIGPAGVCDLALFDPGVLRGALRVDLSLQLRRGLTNHPFGLVFGRGPDDSAYQFKITADGSFKLARWDGRSFIDLVPYRADPVIRTGLDAVNVLTIEVRGQAIQLFINGKPVGSVTVASPVAGRIGVNLNERGMKVLLTRLYVAELDLPSR